MIAGELVLDPLSRGSASLVRRFAAPGRRLAFWITLWIAVAVAEFGALAPVLFGHDEQVVPIDIVFRLVGGSFAACGLIAWHRRPDNHSGRLMTATGFAFFVSPLLGRLDSPLAQTLALVLPDLWVLFFVPLLLTFLTGGRLRTGVERVLVAVILLDLLVLSPLWLMFSAEEGNLLLVVPDAQIAGIVDTAQRVVFIVVLVVTAAVVGARWAKASGPGRRALRPGAAGAICLLLFAALLILDLVTGRRSQVLLWIATCSIITVPGAFLAGLLRSRLARGALTDLFRELPTMQPARLQTALARALGDPALLIAYRQPGATAYVDTDGEPVTLPEARTDRSVALVERDGRQIAALVYDASLDDDPELVEAVGSAATIALENRRLHAEAETRLAELRASRERVIAAGDAERRRIERNLHDGAQQRLVTLALQLSLIRRRIRQDPSEAEQLVTSASDELARSLDELRELARGIHPAALDHGLETALEALALRAAVPTVVVVERGPPLPEPVEFAAYFVASEALANTAKYAHATTSSIRVVCTPREVVIEITDDGVGGADPALGSGLRGLADRVEALRGRFRVSSPVDGGTVVTAQLPIPA
jgi:signal transduction histidine kinase